jgi:transposase-like protein
MEGSNPEDWIVDFTACAFTRDGSAKAEMMPGVEHRRHKGLNNRAENSHQPTRLREPGMSEV